MLAGLQRHRPDAEVVDLRGRIPFLVVDEDPQVVAGVNRRRDEFPRRVQRIDAVLRDVQIARVDEREAAVLPLRGAGVEKLRARAAAHGLQGVEVERRDRPRAVVLVVGEGEARLRRANLHGLPGRLLGEDGPDDRRRLGSVRRGRKRDIQAPGSVEDSAKCSRLHDRRLLDPNRTDIQRRIASRIRAIERIAKFHGRIIVRQGDLHLVAETVFCGADDRQVQRPVDGFEALPRGRSAVDTKSGGTVNRWPSISIRLHPNATMGRLPSGRRTSNKRFAIEPGDPPGGWCRRQGRPGT